MTSRPGVLAILLLALLLAGVSLASGAGAQGVTVALTPHGQEVAPGSEFVLDIAVTQESSPFNGFDVVIEYDPNALTFVPMSPLSLQEGSLMTSACGNRFHRFRQGTQTDSITDVLLCSGVSVTGPGQIYRLKFRASMTQQITVVRFLPGLRFYNAGVFVEPVNSTNASVGIGVDPNVGVGPQGTPADLGLSIRPNPARGGAVFALEAARAGPQKISLFDVRGRLVRSFEHSMIGAGTRSVAWDGLDQAGRAVPAGVYVVTFEAARRSVSHRLTLIR